MQPADILILSNGPGEVTTWVRPVVKAIREIIGCNSSQVRISVVLSPCPHATGQEAAIARRYLEVDRVQSSEHFFNFLFWGKTAENWNWHKHGIVLFLGGDQFYPILLGKRLGYRTVIYAEREARWYRWIDRFGVMNTDVIKPIPKSHKHKLTVVGDLMADLTPTSVSSSQIAPFPTIAILPGSKPGKLMQGIPLCLAIAEQVYQQNPKTRFILPVAPTLDLYTLAGFANSSQNPMVMKMGGVCAKLVMASADSSPSPRLETSNGLQVELITQFPAYNYLCHCCLALTTVGANTAELGALGIPMIVLLPTQQLDAMRTWDGIPGILASLPLVGRILAKTINLMVLKQGRLFAWPNLWANEEIVPELVGELQPTDVAELILDWLANPIKLTKIRDRLLQVRGRTGAATELTNILKEQLNLLNS
ncbi:lipid-A-disaccharide synthase [cyanobacterium endosymbiont of Rhopalodia gibberula]|uniref:lipid-A-disaccharide synthase n=1 Tax=cyanobacterium endosymbiont of Rhopalodia gibberula TaxID=1763363 RepID=UPI000DC6D6E7|nr:lipid-A-disaccharide synthase [cyanobacterium endosymbiont of Rhopalodia gibberula]BBA79073.1 lipid-A-disaccharide synthase [cyanobacterium endosymbiont of Rhopalodia gibberula]